MTLDTLVTHLLKFVISLPFREMVNRLIHCRTANAEFMSAGQKIYNHGSGTNDHLATVEVLSIESSPCLDDFSVQIQKSKPQDSCSDPIHWKFFVSESCFGTDHPMQDAVYINEERHMAAIADGVSQSLMPELFSQELVRNWCQLTAGKIDVPSWFSASCTKWFEDVLGIYELLTSFEQNWYRRGASSTFCGVRLLLPNQIKVWHIGDIVLFLVCDSHITVALPETYISNVRSPVSLNVHDVATSINLMEPKVLDVRDVSAVVICTDAIGDFLADYIDSPVFDECIRSATKSDSAFSEFCKQKCLLGQLRPDDYSIIIMERVKV